MGVQPWMLSVLKSYHLKSLQGAQTHLCTLAYSLPLYGFLLSLLKAWIVTMYWLCGLQHEYNIQDVYNPYSSVSSSVKWDIFYSENIY